MSASSHPASPPSAARLEALDSDAWAQLLAVVREVLGRPHRVSDASLAGFRDAPISRLVGGRLRVRLAARLASDVELWTEVAEAARPAVSAGEILSLLARESDEVSAAAEADASPQRDAAHRHDQGDRAADELRRRLKEARRDRDTWRRRAEAADLRVGRLDEELRRARGELETLRAELSEATTALAAAAVARDRAVQRERRRRDAEIAKLQAELSEVRRAEEERRRESRRRSEVRRQAELDAQRAAAVPPREESGGSRVVPGRPSRLPRGVEPGSTQAARLLLTRGRMLLVDGYNVSMQHHGELDLEMQRNWLVGQLALLARQHGVRPTVVFDGQVSAAGRPAGGLREVQVWFTEEGITADDEIVLAVEGTDEPVVVASDDRELVQRVTASGADVIGTRALLGVLR